MSHTGIYKVIELKRAAALIAGICAISCSSPLSALGLGEFKSDSFLGEPLEATLELVGANDITPEHIRITQLNNQQARKVGIELIYTPYKLIFDDIPEQGSTRTIRVWTDRSVIEPYVNLLVQLEWPSGSVYREYNLLFDARPDVVVSPEPARNERRSSTTRNTPSLIAAGDNYRVRSGDSLSAIVNRLDLPADVSSAEAVQAVFDANPRAFANGNINMLIAGAQLKLPADFKTSLDRNVPGISHDSRSEQTAQSTEAPNAGRLLLSQADAGGSAAGASANDERQALRSKIDGTQEMIDLLVKENAELRERVEKIESSEYLNTLTQLVAMQRKQIEDLRYEMRNPELRDEQDRDDRSELVAASTPDSPTTDERLAGPPNSTGSGAAPASPTIGQSLASNFWAFISIVILGVSLILGAAAAVFWYFIAKRNKQDGMPYESQSAQVSIEQKLEEEFGFSNDATAVEQSKREQFGHGVTSIETHRNKSNRSPLAEKVAKETAEKKKILDDEVKERIKKKTEIYQNSESSGQARSRVNEVEIDVLVGLDEEINELLSMAKIYCSAGKYSEARAILSAQQKIESDPRLAEALQQIDAMENESNQAS